MTLKEIQKMSLRILKDVDEFCQRYQINYSLGYGALIGAIRHKGFIPWDDDIDIIMTRKEYSRFISCFSNDKTIESKGLKLFAPELGNNYFFIARICDMNSTLVNKYYMWTDENVGIWIDLFVIDSYIEEKYKLYYEQNAKCIHSCCASVPFSFNYSILRNIKNLRWKVMCMGYNRLTEIHKYLLQIKQLPSFGTTFKVCNYASPYHYKDIHKKNIFERYIRVPFEDLEVSVIADYDKYLKTIYGDYMELPPLSKRKRGHTDNKYYWK